MGGRFGQESTLYHKGLNLDIDKVFTPEIGTTVSGSASDTVAGVGVDVWFAGASIDCDIQQTDIFTPNSIDGTLLYGLYGTTETRTMDFSLGSDATEILNVSLDQPGTWDFSFLPFTLDNEFNVEFDLEVVARAYYKTLESPKWWQFWNYYWQTHSTEYALLDLDVYDADPFALTFDSYIEGTNVFSISVGEGGGSSAVPEPATMLLLGFGLIGLAGLRGKV